MGSGILPFGRVFNTEPHKSMEDLTPMEDPAVPLTPRPSFRPADNKPGLATRGIHSPSRSLQHGPGIVERSLQNRSAGVHDHQDEEDAGVDALMSGGETAARRIRRSGRVAGSQATRRRVSKTMPSEASQATA